MAGVALFDTALVAYPLYQTSRHILDTRDVGGGDEDDYVDAPIYYASDRWLTFWLTFGLVELLQGFGADGIPGFHLAKALVLLSLYSVEHATLVSAFMPRVCAGYIQGTDKARKWWNESAIPQVKTTVENTSWITSVKDRLYGLVGWGSSPKPKESE
jgi:hypothetical protein